MNKKSIEKKINFAIIILSIIYLLIDIPHFFIYRQEQVKNLGVLYEPHYITYIKWLFVILFLLSATKNNSKVAYRLTAICFLFYLIFTYLFILHHSMTGSVIMLMGGLEIIALLSFVKLIYILFLKNNI